MKSVYNFVVTPKGNRYKNKTKVGDSELILNTDIFNHQYTNREAIVISTPLAVHTEIKPGDTVVVHHNVFRRWNDVKGIEKNSKAYFNENTYFINNDQIFLYKRKDKWVAPKGYCFVKPLKAINQFTKKLAIFDAFEILNRIQEEENLLEGKTLEEAKEKTFKGFAEGRSK